MGQGVSQIKAATNHLSETFVMRMRMKEFVIDHRRPLGRWAVSKNYVDCPERGAREVELQVGTWNVWIDREGDPEARWTALFGTLLSEREGERLDVVCLQEVVLRSYELLLAREEVRKDWIIVDFEDVLQRTSSWYGTMILVRRSWMAAAGLDHVEASLTRYESKMGRSMLAVELSNADGIALRIGTSHWESGTEDVAIRQRQFLTASRLLSFPSSTSVTEDAPSSFPPSIDDLTPGFTPPSDCPPSILCGDTNLTFASELAVLTSSQFGYSDAYAQLHTLDDAYVSHPTFYTTYPTPSPRPDMHEKRIDIVLLRGCEALDASRVGDEPVLGAGGSAREDPRGRDGKMYPSDHLGVVVRLKVQLGTGA